MPLWLYIIIAIILLIYQINFYIKNPDEFKRQIKNSAIVICVAIAILVIIGVVLRIAS